MMNPTYSVSIGTLIGKEKMAEIRKSVTRKGKPARKDVKKK